MGAEQFDRRAGIEQHVGNVRHIERDAVHGHPADDRHPDIADEGRAAVAELARPAVRITDRNGCDVRYALCRVGQAISNACSGSDSA